MPEQPIHGCLTDVRVQTLDVSLKHPPRTWLRATVRVVTADSRQKKVPTWSTEVLSPLQTQVVDWRRDASSLRLAHHCTADRGAHGICKLLMARFAMFAWHGVRTAKTESNTIAWSATMVLARGQLMRRAMAMVIHQAEYCNGSWLRRDGDGGVRA